MKKRTIRLFWCAALILLAAVLVFVNLPDATPATEGADVGERLSDFRAACVDGDEFHLSEYQGKVVVIDLWATWCTPCVRELPSFDRLQREHPEEVTVLALHVQPVTSDVQEWLSAFSYEIPFAVDVDGSLGSLLKASTVLPQTVIVDPDGIVTYNQPGVLSYEDLLELVNEAKQ